MNTISSGPLKPQRTPDQKRTRAVADVWNAVWSASQHLTADEIHKVVEDTFRDIDADQQRMERFGK
jgi:Fe2+ or Zn2+ uptake regulation protein